ncbi:esterase family protein [Tropicimonas sp. IMCC34011]|uniref:alpha/beta hydrolase n=1 Tax=Tropicimonas sp. IMCC34011 TaxID=2248759 RepID=UPI0013007112|nr:alpha/beta hydrolase-fold protein [Tropicimonas sp. IMCC34011]
MTRPTAFAMTFVAATICAAPIAMAQQAPASTGTVTFDAELESDALTWTPLYSVYLPPAYEENDRAYPVIYLMPGGAGQTHRDWFLKGGAAETFDRLIGSGEVPPFIAIVPDPRRTPQPQFNTYYLNDADGEVRYEDMFVQDLIPHVEETYRVLAEEEYRGIIGLSMGGFAALAYSMKYPDMFTAAAALSPAIRTDPQMLAMDQAGWDRRYGMIWGEGLEGEERLNEKYRADSVFAMIEDADAETLGATEYFIDVGSDDVFFEGSVLLHNMLRSEGTSERTFASDHRFMVREGGHVWSYWREGLPEAVRFVMGVMQN